MLRCGTYPSLVLERGRFIVFTVKRSVTLIYEISGVLGCVMLAGREGLCLPADDSCR